MTRPVWFVRHGESTANAAGILAGQDDVALSAQGRAQARQLATLLADLQPERLWASDLRRAWQTAELAWPRATPPLERHPELRERHAGDWEGLPFDQIPAAARSQLLTWDGRPTNGESQAMVAQRVLGFLAARDDGRPTLLFVHAGVIRCVVGLLDGTSTNQIGTFKVRNAQVVARDVARGQWDALLTAQFPSHRGA